MGFQGHIAAGPLHAKIFEPAEEFLRPRTINHFFGKINPIEVKERLNLIFTPGLLSNHTRTGSNQAAILPASDGSERRSPSAPPSEGSWPVCGIGRVPFLCSFFIGRRDIRRIGHDAVNSLLPKLIVSPEAAKTGFIRCMIVRSGKVPFKIMDELCPLPEVG